MAHILFIYKQFPAPSVGHAGGESLFGLMTALHRRGHRISLVARTRGPEREHLPQVAAICAEVITTPHHRDLPGPAPFAIARSYLAFRRAVARALRDLRPDAVHVETTQTAAILIGQPLPPASFRTQDVNWFLQEQRAARLTGVRRTLAQLKATLFRYLEPALYRRYDLILAISEGDRALMAPHFPAHDLLLLPLAPGLDPTSAPIPGFAPEPAAPRGANLLFVGAMDRQHNLTGIRWFLDEIWPRVRREAAEARLYIVGGSPPPALRERVNDEENDEENEERVIVTGFVEDLAPWYRAADVFISPLLVAGGLLQKVMDALAMGVPVVATTVCNHGLGATPGEHLITADEPSAFAEAVIGLLNDPAARARLGENGRRFLQKAYHLPSAVDRWEESLLALIQRDQTK